MSELFSNDNIFLNVNVNSQNEAIEKAGKALVDSGAVTDAYIQAMKIVNKSYQHLWKWLSNSSWHR